MKTKVITYQAPNGESINLTPAQVKTLTIGHKWPKNWRGEEYCTVSHGLHWGEPSCDNCDIDELLAL